MPVSFDKLAFAILIGLTFGIIYFTAIQRYDYEKTLPQPYVERKIEDIRKCINGSDKADVIKACEQMYNRAYKDLEK